MSGYATNSNERISSLNVGSSTKSLKLLATFETYDKEFAEKIIHCALHPFKIIGRREWFYFKNENEMIYALNTIKHCINFIEKFDINENEIDKENNVNLENFLVEINKENVEKALIIKEKQKEKRRLVNINILQQKKNKTDNFKGTTFANDKQQWKAEVQHENKRYFLGYFKNEVEAAQVYNDHVLFLNQTENTNFSLNDIPGYITVARNVIKHNESVNVKTSKYHGVSYDSRRKYFVCSIRCAGKSINLCTLIDREKFSHDSCEIELAKMYNQQALYFNNTLKTKFELNEIENYITLPQDFRQALIDKKLNKKSSKYIGVSINRTGKYIACYTLNRKKVHIGTFETELEACQAYNNTVEKLNKDGCNYKINFFTS